MSSQGVLNEHFPMRIFTGLLLNLNYMRHIAPTLIKPIQKIVISRIRNSHPVGVSLGKLKQYVTLYVYSSSVFVFWIVQEEGKTSFWYLSQALHMMTLCMAVTD